MALPSERSTAIDAATLGPAKKKTLFSQRNNPKQLSTIIVVFLLFFRLKVIYFFFVHFVGDGITWSNVITGFQVVVVVHSVKRLGSSLYLYTLLDMMLIKNTKICSQVAVDGPSVCCTSCCCFFLASILDIPRHLFKSLLLLFFWLLF